MPKRATPQESAKPILFIIFMRSLSLFSPCSLPVYKPRLDNSALYSSCLFLVACHNKHRRARRSCWFCYRPLRVSRYGLFLLISYNPFRGSTAPSIGWFQIQIHNISRSFYTASWVGIYPPSSPPSCDSWSS